jgi:hypothetical protein
MYFPKSSDGKLPKTVSIKFSPWTIWFDKNSFLWHSCQLFESTKVSIVELPSTDGKFNSSQLCCEANSEISKRD